MQRRSPHAAPTARVETLPIPHRGPAITLLCGVMGSLLLALGASQVIPLALGL